MTNSIVVLFIIFSLFQCKHVEKAGNSEEVLKPAMTIAFGSCNKETKEQILWDDILADKPDSWIWLGDNVYGDTEDGEVMKAKYDLQKQNLDYQKLIESTSIYGIWDDHDYGKNNAGKEFSKKDEMRDLMLDFLQVPRSNPVWERKGGYQSYELSKEGLAVKLILLDSRYFRDEPKMSGRNYQPNLEGSILGNEQWDWLEQELQSTTADLILIGNGIQVLPEEHRFEKWANFPNERQKLIDLIRQYGKRTILLSGDRHITEVSRLKRPEPLYEVTCSGMTHSYTKFKGEDNQHRIGSVVTEKNYGLLHLYVDGEAVSAVFQARGDGGRIIMQEELN